MGLVLGQHIQNHPCPDLEAFDEALFLGQGHHLHLAVVELVVGSVLVFGQALAEGCLQLCAVVEELGEFAVLLDTALAGRNVPLPQVVEHVHGGFLLILPIPSVQRSPDSRC